MEVSKIISDFEHISLAQMDGVKLMNRTDTKYTFSYSKLNLLLKKMQPFYKILEINNQLIHSYKSLYYDTEDRKFYLDHHNNRVNRNKVRFREYVGSNLTFLEIKLKNNKGRTIKKRMKVDSIVKQLSAEHKQYINKVVGSEINLLAQQNINFDRITFVHKKNKERLTIDLDLTFQNDLNKGDLKKIVIAEVKQERMSRSSDFIRIAKELSILPMRLSKYCMSTLELNPEIKSNRFKKKQLYINKIKRT
tara:strand:+ start:111 stop:857 length:747 start_codon:yes stop_codon:yes gene_type:complete